MKKVLLILCIAVVVDACGKAPPTPPPVYGIVSEVPVVDSMICTLRYHTQTDERGPSTVIQIRHLNDLTASREYDMCKSLKINDRFDVSDLRGR
ncbi:MAG: hypothetical protein JWL82_530 [Parcubacteria group bacterium]|nr:hypothetical protein [Parcubacteria group bacterium]